MQTQTPQQNTRKRLHRAGLFVLCICCVLCLTACSASKTAGGIFSVDIKSAIESFLSRYTTGTTTTTTSGASTTTATSTADPADLREVFDTVIYLPTVGEDGTAQSVSASACVDYANAGDGYVMVQYLGTHTGQIKLQLTGPDSLTYTYNLTAGAGYETFPLTGGSGSYTLNIYEQDSGTSYYLVDSATFTATIPNELSPYLYPNKYVSYTQDSAVVALSVSAASACASELDLVENVYYDVLDTLSYDYDLAELISSGGLSSYIPDLDAVIESEVGICFDYASLMVAMLRIQQVPAKLVIGYAGEAYHAWINVYTEEQGWVDGAIYFDGESWSLIDPTFADTAASNSYVGDGTSYTEKYVY